MIRPFSLCASHGGPRSYSEKRCCWWEPVVLLACPSGEAPNVYEDALLGGRAASGFCFQDFLRFHLLEEAVMGGNNPFPQRKQWKEFY